jgi:hypothetical protein
VKKTAWERREAALAKGALVRAENKAKYAQLSKQPKKFFMTGYRLGPGGPSNMSGGKSTATIKAHLRKGKAVRQHQRKLGVQAHDLLREYRETQQVKRRAVGQFFDRPAGSRAWARKKVRRIIRSIRSGATWPKEPF